MGYNTASFLLHCTPPSAARQGRVADRSGGVPAPERAPSKLRLGGVFEGRALAAPS